MMNGVGATANRAERGDRRDHPRGASAHATTSVGRQAVAGESTAFDAAGQSHSLALVRFDTTSRHNLIAEPLFANR